MPQFEGNSLSLSYDHTAGKFVPAAGGPLTESFPPAEALEWMLDDAGELTITFSNAKSSTPSLSVGTHTCTSMSTSGNAHTFTVDFVTSGCSGASKVECTFSVVTAKGTGKLVLLPKKKGSTNPTHVRPGHVQGPDADPEPRDPGEPGPSPGVPHRKDRD